MNESADLVRLHQEAGPPVPPGDHPAPESLATAARESGEGPERLAVLDHVAGCPECRADYALLRSLATAEAGDLVPAARHLPRWLPLAAAVVLGLGVTLIWPRLRPSPADQLRDGTSGGPELLAPPSTAPAAGARVFVWRPVQGALRYEFELLDVHGRVVATARTADTALTLPDSVALGPGGDYRWWVAAAWPDGARLRSPARRLAITSP